MVTWEAGCTLLEGFGERVDGEIGLWTLGSACVDTARREGRREMQKDDGKMGLK